MEIKKTQHFIRSAVLFIVATISFSAEARVSECENALSVMHYNVEWLASSRDQEKFTTIPGDMHREIRTKEWAEIRMKRVAEVVRAAGPKLPDILVLSEVLDFAAAEHLAKKLGYNRPLSTFAAPGIGSLQVVMIRKEAGAQVLSRHEVPVSFNGKTLRPILELVVKRGPQEMVLYANHWPSPRKSEEYQMAAAIALKSAIRTQRIKHPGIPILAVGDFNMPKTENHPAFREMLREDRAFRLFDLQSTFESMKAQGRLAGSPLFPGTHYYYPESHWSFLDRVFYSGELSGSAQSCIELLMKSYRVVHPKFATQPLFAGAAAVPEFYVPHRFMTIDEDYPFDRDGYSDHLPLTFSIDFSKCAESSSPPL